MPSSRSIRTSPLSSVISNIAKITWKNIESVINNSYRSLFNRSETRRWTKVHGKTKPWFPPPNSSWSIDSRFTFECIIDGTEPINVIWLKEQTIISSLTHDIQYERGLASLNLVDVQSEDSAYYTCRASNTAGTVESSAYLLVKGRHCRLELSFVDDDCLSTERCVSSQLQEIVRQWNATTISIDKRWLTVVCLARVAFRMIWPGFQR